MFFDFFLYFFLHFLTIFRPFFYQFSDHFLTIFFTIFRPFLTIFLAIFPYFLTIFFTIFDHFSYYFQVAALAETQMLRLGILDRCRFFPHGRPFFCAVLGDKYGVPFEAFHPGLAGACGSRGVAVEMMRVG
jgi:hypothetical protein